VDAPASLAALLELSTQVVEAVVAGPGGVEAASPDDAERAGVLAAAGAALLDAATPVRPGSPAVERVVVETETATVIVVRDGARSIVVTTVPEPTVGLVVYDLRSALRRIGGAGS
jgi:predicted regulator of Ras-like GTPase activity (Roadblock/LC7/MglB family)